MAVNEGLKPLDPTDQIDPNVRVPDHVRRAADEAARIHAAAYAPEPDPAAAAQAAAATAEAERAAAAQAQTQVQDPATQAGPQVTTGDDFTGNADPAALRDSEWARRYNSMHGRWQQSERSRAGMEQQMSELGQELVRTQNLLSTLQAAPAANPQLSPSTPVHGNLITEEDRASYGDELISLAQRAALQVVNPQLEQLKTENANLTNQVKTTSRRELFTRLDHAVPNWRAINVSTQFKTWLRLPNVYTGQIRGNMLKAAVDGAEAPKVIALLQDFLREAAATGQQVPVSQTEQQAIRPVPREAAVSLETLAAPGRARPASGDSQVPVEKPTYSRAEIAKFYDNKRRGLYAGREAEIAAFETDMIAAQGDGRIRG